MCTCVYLIKIIIIEIVWFVHVHVCIFHLYYIYFYTYYVDTFDVRSFNFDPDLIVSALGDDKEECDLRTYDLTCIPSVYTINIFYESYIYIYIYVNMFYYVYILYIVKIITLFILFVIIFYFFVICYILSLMFILAKRHVYFHYIILSLSHTLRHFHTCRELL